MIFLLNIQKNLKGTNFYFSSHNKKLLKLKILSSFENNEISGGEESWKVEIQGNTIQIPLSSNFSKVVVHTIVE